jgi:hypothetical protein
VAWGWAIGKNKQSCDVNIVILWAFYMWKIRLIFLDKDRIMLKGEQKEGYKKPHGAIKK